MPLKVATQIVDLWLMRGRRLTADERSARAAAAHLSPAVVVTGGTRGIGAAIARRFAISGSRVAIVSRGISHPDSPLPAGSVSITCDAADPRAFALISERLAAEGLYLDVLVNNAGVGLAGPFTSHAEADIDALLALNIAALTRLTRAALPDMLARRRGGILNVASLGAYTPGPHQAAYYASKAYVLSLTEALAAENAGRGLRFSALATGPVNTAFHAAMGAEASLYRQLMPALSPDRAARAAYRGFMLNQRVIAPGLLNRAALGALKILPHPLTVPLVRWLLRRPQD